MRSVLGIDRFGQIDQATGAEKMVIRVVRAPFNIAGGNTAFPLALSADLLPPWDTANAVQERGRIVRTSLRKHPGVAKLLDQLEMTPKGEIKPLYVAIAEGEAEQITWETLCDTQDSFVALDPRWPIGRISDPVAGRSFPPAVLHPPIRVMAVVSAFKVHDQQREWDLFHAAATAARANGLDVRLKLLVAHPDLRATIDASIAGGEGWVEVGHVEKTAQRLVQDICAWKPEILHFFCHGISDETDQWLELATALDYKTPATKAGSVKVRVAQLTDLTSVLPDPWLLTLNCCSSGQAAEELQSMAHQVVSAGFPAAVAMLEPVAAGDAYEFTRSFYASLFEALRRVELELAKQDRVTFEWVEPMYSARAALSDLHAGDPKNCREWALPVLYVRGIEPFFFTRPAPAAVFDTSDAKTKASVVAQWLVSVRDQMPEDQRRAIMQTVLAGVPASLWPNVDGTFTNA
jgi:hypothetical protein